MFKSECKKMLFEILQAAFGFNKMNNIDLVYPKEQLKNENDLRLPVESLDKNQKGCLNQEEFQSLV